MVDALSDERLDAILTSVGEHLVVPQAPESITPVGTRRGRSRHPLAAAAVAVAILLVVVAATLNPVQDAIADMFEWLDIGSTRVERTEPGAADPAGLQPITADLPTVSRERAQQALGRPLPRTRRMGLGAPDAIATPPEGGVLLAWRREGTSLWIRPTADPPGVMLQKLLDEHDTVERVTGLGDAAVSVGGPHVLATPHRRIAAESAVLWIDDGVEYRLESTARRAQLLAMARALAPA
jgi:hypothetical protein